MDKQRRLLILSLALVALVFTGAYALAGDGGGDPQPSAPGDAPAAIETPDGVEVPGAPPGGSLPELGVPTPTPTPDAADPGSTTTPEPQPSAQPQDADPTVVPDTQATPEPTADPPVQEGGEN